MPERTTSMPLREKGHLFLQQLKTATAPQHAALEAQPLLRALMTPQINEKQYRHYLLRMRKIIQAYEADVWPRLAAAGFVFKQRSSVLIAEDLRLLAASDDDGASLPDFIFPKNSTLPFAWGFAYVMEGSKLGGRVIFKHLQKAIGLSDCAGGAYLANRGADTGAEWKEFLQNLLACTTTYDCGEEVLNGAVFGFTAIHHYFEANGPAHDD